MYGLSPDLSKHKLLICLAVRSLLIGVLAAASLGVLIRAHGFGASITWNREISRIVYEKCATCHRPEGAAFSLMTYPDVQPRANAIKDAVLARRMPPWGAVKGFGQFRNDQSLSQEQIELVTKWVDGGIRRGNNPNMLPRPPAFKDITVSPPEVAARVSCGDRSSCLLVPKFTGSRAAPSLDFCAVEDASFKTSNARRTGGFVDRRPP